MENRYIETKSHEPILRETIMYNQLRYDYDRYGRVKINEYYIAEGSGLLIKFEDVHSRPNGAINNGKRHIYKLI